jgi:hypothetical protein
VILQSWYEVPSDFVLVFSKHTTLPLESSEVTSFLIICIFQEPRSTTHHLILVPQTLQWIGPGDSVWCSKCVLSVALHSVAKDDPVVDKNENGKDQGPVSCDMCSKTYKNRATLYSHKNRDHGIRSTTTPKWNWSRNF